MYNFLLKKYTIFASPGFLEIDPPPYQGPAPLPTVPLAVEQFTQVLIRMIVVLMRKLWIPTRRKKLEKNYFNMHKKRNYLIHEFSQNCFLLDVSLLHFIIVMYCIASYFHHSFLFLLHQFCIKFCICIAA